MPMYFTGKKASGYITITDPTLPNGKIEIETRMCAHCGKHWIYNPGNAKVIAQYTRTKNFINGICIKCQGLTCMSPICNSRCDELERKFDEVEKGKRPFFLK